MKLTEKLLKVDIGVQILLMGTMLACLIVAVFLRDKEILLSLIGLELFLGMWQVFSALIWGIIYRDKTRWRYLGAVVLYFFSLMVLMGLFHKMENLVEVLVSIMVCVVPVFYALWYVFQTWKDIHKIQNYPRSFWDLT